MHRDSEHWFEKSDDNIQKNFPIVFLNLNEVDPIKDQLLFFLIVHSRWKVLFLV